MIFFTAESKFNGNSFFVGRGGGGGGGGGGDGVRERERLE